MKKQWCLLLLCLPLIATAGTTMTKEEVCEKSIEPYTQDSLYDLIAAPELTVDQQTVELSLPLVDRTQQSRDNIVDYIKRLKIKDFKIYEANQIRYASDLVMLSCQTTVCFNKEINPAGQTESEKSCLNIEIDLTGNPSTDNSAE